jgi:hypothetical protein
MEPITLILTALSAGVSAAVKDTAGQAVRDAYAGLKSLIKRKLGGKAAAESALEQHEQAPEEWEKPLEHQLADAGVDQDEEIVRAAQRLLALADPEGARAGKFNVTITGGKGVVVGDQAQVTMTFEDED